MLLTPAVPDALAVSGIAVIYLACSYRPVLIVLCFNSQAAQQKPPQAAQQQKAPEPADAVAMKREYAPAEEVAAAAERIAPGQTHAREITSTGGDVATRQPSDMNGLTNAPSNTPSNMSGLTSAPSDASDIKVSCTSQ